MKQREAKRRPPIRADRSYERSRDNEGRQEVLSEQRQRCGGGFRIVRKRIGGA